MNAPDLSVIVFAFNEAENIAPVLAELRAWLEAHEPEAEIVFVDDGSTDGTATVAESALDGVAHQIVRHRTNRGIGAALKSGVRTARGAWITFLPADGQIPPDAIGTLRHAARRNHSPVVFSLYDDRDDGVHRKVLSAGVRLLIRMVHGVRMQSDGPYLFRRELFDTERMAPDSFFLNFEFPIRMLAQGTPTASVTIPCRPRLAGRSKSTDFRRIAHVARDLLHLRLRLIKELSIAPEQSTR